MSGRITLGDIIGALDDSAGDDSAGEDILAGLMDDSSSGEDVLAGLMDDSSSSGDIIGDIIGGSDGSNLLTLAGALGGKQAQKKIVKQVLLNKLLGKGGGQQQRRAPPGARRLQYSPRKYDTSRVVPIGFDSVAAVPAFTSATLTQRPQEPFRPSRLFIPSDIAGSFLIDDIKVGNRSQLAANGSLPARMFQENATGIILLLDTADPAIDVVLRVTNISGAAVRFLAGMVGPAVE